MREVYFLLLPHVISLDITGLARFWRRAPVCLMAIAARRTTR